jgi:16S rRNA (uracil1498-N3)-methyltransferase
MELRHTHRLFVTARLTQGAVLAICDMQAHHLINVLRLKAGDVVRLFNGQDGEWRGEIASVRKKDIDIAVKEQLRMQMKEPDLWLCPAPIKKAHFDYMIEKATELGVSEIQPILTQRAQVREINGDRIYAICREAATQSDRLGIPAVGGEAVELSKFIEVFPKERAAIVCAEWGEALDIHTALSTPALRLLTKAAIITGPEGGFAAEELDALRKIPNAHFVRLGPRVLRADTAAIAALACWQAIQGDWK